MIQVMRLKAGNVSRDIKSGRREFLIERMVARRSRPLEDALGAFLDQLSCVAPVEAAMLLALLHQLLGAIRKDHALAEQIFDALLGGGIEVVGHEH